MIRLLEILLRRRRYVVVDEAAWCHMIELVVIGETLAVLEAEEQRFLDLDCGDSPRET